MKPIWICGYEQISFLGTGREAVCDASRLGAAETLERGFPWLGVTSSFDFLECTGQGDLPAFRQMDTLGKYAVACSSLVLRNLEVPDLEHNRRVGIVLGSAFGCTASNHMFLNELVASGARRVSPTVFRNTVSNAAAGHVATTCHLLGSNSVLNSGAVSGVQSLSYGFDSIADGRCQTMLVGAVDHASEVMRARFCLQNEHYRKAEVPLLDGACIFLLSSGRPASRWSWQLAGYEMGFVHGGTINEGLKRVVFDSIRNAGMSPSDIGAYQLHADLGDLWIRSDGNESLEHVIRDCTAKLGLPRPENSALPATLALADSLELLAGNPSAGLFLRNKSGLSAKWSKPRVFIFAALGPDGNVVVLLLKNAALA